MINDLSYFIKTQRKYKIIDLTSYESPHIK